MQPPGRFISSVTPSHGDGEPALWFAVRDFHPLVVNNGGRAEFPVIRSLGDLGLEHDRHHYLGSFDGRPAYAAELPLDAEPPSGAEFVNLRQVFGQVEDELWTLAGRAVQIVDWDRTHRFCGRCGTETELAVSERAKRCPSCGHRAYPRLSPAVIVAVHRDDRILLGRSSRFPNAFYSVLAGFVEPGESLEETVAREVYEESGIRVDDIRYFGSQPWPFPNSLMIGFTARYAGGEIVLLDDEIREADWFSIDNLPEIPGRISIARRLIDWWVGEQGAEGNR